MHNKDKIKDILNTWYKLDNYHDEFEYLKYYGIKLLASTTSKGSCIMVINNTKYDIHINTYTTKNGYWEKLLIPNITMEVMR